MKFLVYNKLAGGAPKEYDVKNIYEVFDAMFDDWAYRGRYIQGVIDFLEENDWEFDEDREDDIIEEAVDKVRELFGPPEERNLEQLALFLAAINEEYEISSVTGGCGVDTSDSIHHEIDETDIDEALAAEFERKLDEDYDY